MATTLFTATRHKAVSLLEGIKAKVSHVANILYSKDANIIDVKKLLQKLNSNGGNTLIDSLFAAELISQAVKQRKKPR